MSARTVPETTAEERERYRELARWYAELCAAVEPEHAAVERDEERTASAAEAAEYGYTQRPRWRGWWRTLPDYDGGPQRAPSGTCYVIPSYTPRTTYESDYTPPDRGGRGWCPLLAAVQP